MNWIKESRESLEWTQERLAANLCCAVPYLDLLERGEPVSEYYASLLNSVFTQRGVVLERDEFGRVNRVVGPSSDEALEKIILSAAERNLLEVLDRVGAFGCPVKDSERSLRNTGLVQLGAVREIAIFDDGEVTKETGRQVIRLSRRGRAWLELQARLKMARFRL